MCYFVYRHDYLKVAIICKGKELSQNINILIFNVEGLKPKLQDPNFPEFIKDYDISILSEAWIADISKLNIEGFWNYSQVRPKHKIVILEESLFLLGLKLVENSEGFLWFRLEKSFFNPEMKYFFKVLIFHQNIQLNINYLKQTTLAL